MNPGSGNEPFIPDIRPDPSYLHEFVISAMEILDNCEQAAMDVQENPSNLEIIFRGMHTLKGDSGYLGFSRLGAFCHDMETLLTNLIKRLTDTTADVTDMILQAIDLLRETVSGLETPERGIPDPEPVWDLIRSLISEKNPEDRDPRTEKPPADPAIPAGVRDVFIEQAASYRQTLLNLMGGVFPADRQGMGAARRTLGSLSHAGASAGYPDISDVADDVLDRMENRDERRYTDGLHELLTLLESVTGPAPSAGETGDTPESDDRAVRISSTHRSMRVDEEKIEHLFALVNEFDLARSRSDFSIREILSGSDGADIRMREFKVRMDHFSRLITDLRRSVENLRTIKAGTVLRKFERLVRDISVAQKKKIRLAITGASHEIDKTVADILSEPLTHAIRNACDHGIETVDERIAAGKNPEGTVGVDLKQEGGTLTVTIRDDGRGIDPERILAGAEKLGIPTDDLQAESLLELVFVPGFSTSEKVSEISGRGIGMDIIRSSVRSLGGRVRFESTPGSGTTLTLSIPVTVGVMNAVVTEISGVLYAFPLDSIQVALTPHDTEFHTVEGKNHILHGDALIPAVDAESFLYEDSRSGHAVRNEAETSRILVFGTGENAFALTIPNILSRMELSVKPAPGDLKDVPMVSGVSIMGDGRIILVIDPEEFGREIYFPNETVQ